METHLLPRSSVANFPPAERGVLAVLESARSAPAAVAPPVLPYSQNTREISAPAGSGVAIRLPAVRWQLPAAPGPYLADALKSRWQVYRKQLRHCQGHFSEEAVHELRVATRRLLAQFVLLGDVAPSTSLEKARRSLKRRLADLGDLRDTQVQRLFIEQHADRYPGTDSLRLWLDRRERRLIKSAVGKVEGARTKKLERRIAAMAEGLIDSQRRSGTKNRLAAAVLRATTKTFTDSVKRRQAINLSDLGTVHQTRIAFKRFRYMAESLSPGLTGLSKRQLRTLAYYQRRMGIIQDLEVIQRGVRDFTRVHQGTEDSLRPFCRYLRQRRARAVRAFVKNADAIFAFWPPAQLRGARNARDGEHPAGAARQSLQGPAVNVRKLSGDRSATG